MHGSYQYGLNDFACKAFKYACLLLLFFIHSKCSQWHTILATSKFSQKNNSISIPKTLIWWAPCVWVGEQCGQQNGSKRKKMDRRRKGHCCLSIHLRCSWKSSTMTPHPSATGVLLSLLEQNQNSTLSIIPFLLFSRPQLLLSTSFAQCLVLVCVARFWGKTSRLRGWRRRQCEWTKKWRVKEWNKMENDNESVWRIWVYEGGSERAQGKQQHSSCRPNSFLTQCLCSD